MFVSVPAKFDKYFLGSWEIKRLCGYKIFEPQKLSINEQEGQGKGEGGERNQ
jgi:hypothetical protein